MKRILAFIPAMAILFANAAIVDTQTIEYSQTTLTSPFTLTWTVNIPATPDPVTGRSYAVITGLVGKDASDNPADPTGAIDIPASVVDATGKGYVVKEIAAGALANMIGVSAFNIPASVQTIGDGAFANCPLLNTMTVAADNPWFKIFGGALYSRDLKTLYAVPACAEVVSLAPGVVEIKTKAFNGCHLLTSVSVPASVTTIGGNAFLNAGKLASITFEGNAPATVGGAVFSGVATGAKVYYTNGATGFPVPPAAWNGLPTAYAEAEIPSGVTSSSAGGVTWFYRVVNGNAEIYNDGNCAISPANLIQTYTVDPITGEKVGDGTVRIPSMLGGFAVTAIGDGAFKGCSSMIGLEIPAAVTRIGSRAFENCAAAATIVLPDVVRSIGARAFAGTSITALQLPAGLRSLSGNPFLGCDTILNCSIDADNSYFSVIDGVVYDKDQKTLIGCPARKEAVAIPSTVTAIGPEAFSGCFRISAVTLPSSLTTVGNKAFNGCTRLASLVFPARLTTIGSDLFQYCDAIDFIGFTGNAPTADPKALEYSPTWLKVYVAQDTTGWDGTPGSSALPASGKWPTADVNGRPISRLDVSADADLVEGDIFNLLTTNGTEYIAWSLKVLANRGVEILGMAPKPSAAFDVPSEFICSLGRLNVKRLADRLFANCSGLLSVTIPNSVVEIGDFCFTNCDVLGSVKLNHGLRSIGRGAFFGTSVQTIEIPATVREITGNPLLGCDPSAKVTVATGSPYFAVSSEGALYDADFTTLRAVPMTVEELNLPATVTAFDADAFKNCIRLRKITFNANKPTVTPDGNNTFADCHPQLKLLVPRGSDFGATWLTRPTEVYGDAPIAPGGVHTTSDGWKYRVVDRGVEIWNNGENASPNINVNGALAIPAQLDGLNVVAIGTGALANFPAVNAISIPAAVTSIGQNVFTNNTLLASFSVDANNLYFRADGPSLFDYDRTKLIAAGHSLTTWTGPETLTEIASAAFDGCLHLESLNLPASLTTIGANAFRKCSALKIVMIGRTTPPTVPNEIYTGTSTALETVVEAASVPGDWGVAALDGTANWKGRKIRKRESGEVVGDILTDGTWYYSIQSGKAVLYNNGYCVLVDPNTTGSVTVPDSLGGSPVKEIKARSFANCLGITSVSLPDTITDLGDWAFTNCNVLASVKLNYGLRRIGKAPFFDTAIESLEIPDTVQEIVGNPILGCDPSIKLAVAESNPRFAVSSEGALYSKDFTILLAVPMTADELNVPSTVTTIADDAFAGCIRMKMITFNADAPTASNTVFADCHPQLKLLVPNGNNTFGTVPGIWCSRPTEYYGDLPPAEDPTVKTYVDNSGITWHYRIVDGAAEIWNYGKCAIASDKAITGITIPSTIDEYVVNAIGEGALANLRAVSSISLPPAVTKIADGAFTNCAILASVTLNNGLRNIGKGVFAGSAIQGVELPATVRSIDGNLIVGCDPSVSIKVSDASPYFAVSAEGALYDADFTTLRAVPMTASAITLPKTVTAFGKDAFKGAIRLKSLTFAGNAPATVPDGNTTFSDCHQSLVLYVPTGNTSFGTVPGTWRLRPTEFVGESAPGEDDDGDWGREKEYTDANNMTWKYVLSRPGVATITAAPEKNVLSGAITVPTTLGGCPVTTIGDSAFAGRSAMSSCELPSTVTNIGWYAFRYCTTMQSINLPDGLRIIDCGAFYDCERLRRITMPSSVTELGTSAFSECEKLADVELSTGITTIPERAFSGCTSLSGIDFPSSLKSIMADAFYGCSSLGSAIFRQGLETIDKNAFAACSALKKVSFPMSIISLGSYSFYNCTNLTNRADVIFEGPIEPDGVDESYVKYYISNGGGGEEEEEGETSDVIHTTKEGWTYRLQHGNAELWNGGDSALPIDSTSTEIVIPSRLDDYPVKAIGDSAFKDFDNLSTVTIPASVTDIAMTAFDGCSSLKNFIVSGGNAAFKARYGVLYSADGKTLVKVPAKFKFGKTSKKTLTKGKFEVVIAMSIESQRPKIFSRKAITEPEVKIETNVVNPEYTQETLFAGVTAIAGHAFTDCGFPDDGDKVSTYDSVTNNPYIVEVDGELAIKQTVSDTTVEVSTEIPLSFNLAPVGVSPYAFVNSGFTSITCKGCSSALFRCDNTDDPSEFTLFNRSASVWKLPAGPTARPGHRFLGWYSERSRRLYSPGVLVFSVPDGTVYRSVWK